MGVLREDLRVFLHPEVTGWEIFQLFTSVRESQTGNYLAIPEDKILKGASQLLSSCVHFQLV
jgi:hypothetical protein